LGPAVKVASHPVLARDVLEGRVFPATLLEDVGAAAGILAASFRAA